jgi:hypothetical protein
VTYGAQFKFFSLFYSFPGVKTKKVSVPLPVQMENENNSNSVDPTFAVATGTGNTTEDKTARSSLTILLRWFVGPRGFWTHKCVFWMRFE